MAKLVSKIEDIMKNEKKVLAILISISFLILFLEYVYYYIHPIFGVGWDVYVHLAYIQELSKGAIPPNSVFTTSNISENYQCGPYLVTMSYAFALTGLNPIVLLYIAGLINLCLFIFFSFKFVKEILGQRIAVFSVISMLFIWGPLGQYAGVYKIFAAYDFFYPQGVAYTLLFASLYCLCKAKENKRYMIFSIILSVVLFTTHPLTGILYLVLIFLFLLADVYKTKTFNRSYHLFLIGLPIITFLLSLLWPYYSVLDAFLVRAQDVSLAGGIPSLNISLFSPISVPEKYSGNLLYTVGCIIAYKFRPPYTVIHYPVIAGFACFGVIGLWRLIKDKRIFLPLWFTFCFLWVALLCPVYWRFFLFSLIPLHIGFGIVLSNFLSVEKKKFLKYFVVSVLILSFLTTGLVTHLPTTFYPKADLNYDFIIDNTEIDSVIMSEGYTRVKIPALTGRKVVYGLSNDSERLNAVNTFYSPNTTSKEREEILKKYNVSYVVVNIKTKLKPLELFYPIKYQDDRFVLYDCKYIISSSEKKD